MALSSARLLANRRNALKSTGPKSAEGKEKSRRNSLKHGLTGDGVVLPVDQLAEVTRRFETLQADMQPSGEAGRVLLRRFAFLSVRLEKAEEFESSVVAKRVRHAFEIFEDQRMTEVETLVAILGNDPMTAARRLQAMPEGVDWLIKHWGELLDDLMHPERATWTLNHWTRVEQLLGRPGGNFRMTRTYALTQAISGYFVHLNPGDGEGLDDASKIEWARRELASIIDAEVARLGQVKASLNLQAIERDRLEAPSRALFDPSPEMNLARKYEAATERALYKSLNQFYEVELAALDAEPVSVNSLDEETKATVGSFFPKPDPIEEPPPEPEDSAPISVHVRELKAYRRDEKPAEIVSNPKRKGRNTEKRSPVLLN
jgi:hypothetical protein